MRKTLGDAVGSSLIIISNAVEVILDYDAIGNGIAKGNGTTENTFGPMDDYGRVMLITFLYKLFADTAA